MNLMIINGSPRYKKSNSALLINHFIDGYNKQNPEAVPVHYLANRNKDTRMADFMAAQTIIVVFPLYCDSMPGIVKEFMEDISLIDLQGTKRIGYIVQSGFPESVQSTFVERYLKKFTSRLRCEYLGTVIRGGVEGIQAQPPAFTKKLFERFNQLGQEFAKTQAFSPIIVEKLANPYRISRLRGLIVGFASRLSYWDVQLKKNGAYEHRFDRPYQQ